MGFRDLAGDEQAEAEAVAARPGLAAEKRLEQVRARFFGDRIPAFATESVNRPPFEAASKRIGRSGAPWVTALDRRLDAS